MRSRGSSGGSPTCSPRWAYSSPDTARGPPRTRTLPPRSPSVSVRSSRSSRSDTRIPRSPRSSTCRLGRSNRIARHPEEAGCAEPCRPRARGCGDRGDARAGRGREDGRSHPRPSVDCRHAARGLSDAVRKRRRCEPDGGGTVAGRGGRRRRRPRDPPGALPVPRSRGSSPGDRGAGPGRRLGRDAGQGGRAGAAVDRRAGASRSGTGITSSTPLRSSIDRASSSRATGRSISSTWTSRVSPRSANPPRIGRGPSS